MKYESFFLQAFLICKATNPYSRWRRMIGCLKSTSNIFWVSTMSLSISKLRRTECKQSSIAALSSDLLKEFFFFKFPACTIDWWAEAVPEKCHRKMIKAKNHRDYEIDHRKVKSQSTWPLPYMKRVKHVSCFKYAI